MRYFIDFEAAQPSNEIISVGCVAENGEEFYSEVRAKAKITSFITSLTKITNAQNKMADSSDEVFTHFYEWLSQYDNEKAQFFCYGNSDITFVKQNLRKTKCLAAQASLSVIGMNMEDFAPRVTAHFGLAKEISLIKVLAYYRGTSEIKQNHNALEDAKFLKEIYEAVRKEKKVYGQPFPDYLPKSSPLKNTTIPYREILRHKKHYINVYQEKNNKKVLECKCNSIISARNYVINHMPSLAKGAVVEKNVENRIINASKKNLKYCNRYWEIILTE